MIYIRATAGLAAIGLLCSVAPPLSAQEQATPPPVVETPATAPPATTTAPAPVETPATPPPAPTAAETAAPVPAGETPPPATVDTAAPPAEAEPSQTLPEVKVIQEAPKPAPAPKPVEEAAPKPKKKIVKAAPPPPPPAQETPEPAAPEATATIEPPAVPPVATVGPPSGSTAVKMSPMSGSEIPLDKVPGAVGVVSAADVARNGSGQVQNVLQQQVPGIILSDTAGSGFRTDVSYRGFDASPIGGRSQALAIYMNGIRINESFGDTVNWDAIPANAINDIAVVGSNPVFGLNAIGGAISVTMKDGFSYEGGEIDLMGGSFGRKQLAVQAGGNTGGVGAYVAAEAIEEDGFRDFSAAEVKRMFADLAFKGSDGEIHVSFTGAKSIAGVVTAAPVELLAIDYGRTFTSPQDTEYEVMMPSISGRVQATETLSISGLAYYRRFKQNVLDGNLSEVAACDALGPNAGFLCLNDNGVEERVQAADGSFVGEGDVAGPLGSLERINQDAKSFGFSTQAVEKSQLFSRPNQFLVGVSYDHGKVRYDTSSEIGTIGDKFVITGSGIIVNAPDDLLPRDLTSENDYYGVYLSNTLDVTDALSVTVGGRYNHATIKLQDLTGNFPELNTTNKYDRFNPMAGVTYKVVPGLSVYGGYSEANRAPTAAELGCAEPENPCLIESFLTDDPPLKQVVSKSWEAGVRGESTSWDNQKFTWSLGYFRTLNVDDILNVAATTTGRGYFLNAGDTLRQGFEASAGYRNDRLSLYGSYAFIDATFETDLVLSAPNTPGAPDCPDLKPGEQATCNFVSSGDHLPGIPRHRIKAGFEYWLTPQWKFGSDLVAASDQFFFGDEANNNAKLAGYTRVDLHTSYDFNEHVQIYGLVKNLFDKKYGLYGTFFNTDDATEAAEPQGLTFSDPRSVTPAQPFALYGGLKIKF